MKKTFKTFGIMLGIVFVALILTDLMGMYSPDNAFTGRQETSKVLTLVKQYGVILITPSGSKASAEGYTNVKAGDWEALCKTVPADADKTALAAAMDKLHENHIGTVIDETDYIAFVYAEGLILPRAGEFRYYADGGKPVTDESKYTIQKLNENWYRCAYRD